MMTCHRLESAQFDRLAGGAGGAAAIEALRTSQLSRHLLLIGHLLQHWPGDAAERDALVDALEQARQQCPERFGEVFGAPLVGAWTAIAGRAVQRARATWADFNHLGALTMVACAAAGVDAEADVPVRDGGVVLPGLGVLSVPAVGSARVVASGGRLAVRVAGATIDVPAESGAANPGWQPMRFLAGHSCGRQIRLGLDDLDPYRHGHHAPPALRLPPAQVDSWRDLFAMAWQLLAERIPDRAAELAAGLRTLVPLVPGDRHSSRSATIRHAFGVFGLTRPPTAAEFAVTLVHEFQHSKLSAMLDLTLLIDPTDNRRYFAPWRTDPRPLAGLLQGVYAFVGVADTWRALRDVDGIAPSAERQFAEARLQVDSGLASVEGSGALTPAGELVATQLRRVTDALLAEPVRPATARAAEQELVRTKQQWCDRNSAAP